MLGYNTLKRVLIYFDAILFLFELKDDLIFKQFATLFDSLVFNVVGLLLRVFFETGDLPFLQLRHSRHYQQTECRCEIAKGQV